MLLLLILKVVSAVDPLVEDLKIPQRNMGEFCGYESCQRVKQNTLNVHIVPSTLAELGFVKQFEEHYSGVDASNMYIDSKITMKRIFDAVVTELWADNTRRFALSDLVYFFHWWKKRDGSVRRMVYELVRQGRLVFVGGGWSHNDETSTNYQSIIDSFTLGLRKLNDTFGECGRPLVAWQVASYGHSREMASLLAAMGYDGIFVNPISYDDELIRMEMKAFEMIWRGSDDLGIPSDIFTHKLFDGFWSPPGFCFDDSCEDGELIIDSDSTMNNVKEKVKEFMQVTYYRQAPYYRTNNILLILGARHGYYDARKWFRNIDRLLYHVNNEVNNNGMQINAFYSTPACYLRAVYNSNPQLPTKQDDFLPFANDENNYFTGLYTSRPSFKYMEKMANIFFQIAKQVEVTAGMGWHKKQLDFIKWTMGVVQDRNIISGTHRPHVSQYYTTKLHRATQKATFIIGDAYNKIRDANPKTKYYRCLFNNSQCLNTNTERSYIVVYNGLAWPVSVPVRLPTSLPDYIITDAKGQFVDATVMPISKQILQLPLRTTTAELELVFIAKNIPPLGFTSYFIHIKPIASRRVAKSASNDTNNVKHNGVNKGGLQFKDKKNYKNNNNIRKRNDKDIITNSGDNNYQRTNKFINSVINKGRLKVKENKNINNKLLSIESYYTLRPMNNLNHKIPLEVDMNDKSTQREVYSLIDANNDTNYETSEINIESTTIDNFQIETADTDASEAIFDTTNPHNEISSLIDESDEVNNNIDNINHKDFPIDFNNTEINDSTRIDPDILLLKNTNDSKTIDKEHLLDASDVGIIKTNKYHKIPPLIGPQSNTNETKTEDLTQKYLTQEREKQQINKTRILISKYFYGDNKTVPGKIYQYKHIKNENVRINLDKNGDKIETIIANGIELSLDIQFYYYEAFVRNARDKSQLSSGAFIFRPLNKEPLPIFDKNKAIIYTSDIVKEIHITYSDFASIVVRLYNNSSTIEVDWTIGPVPIEDGVGKDVILRYKTNLKNNKEFYTDSNGRQTIKRRLNERGSYKYDKIKPVVGNYYPITSKIYIEDLDKNVRMAVFNDRTQGGSSINEGEIELMIHRRLISEEINAYTVLNETEANSGLVVRGKHYIYFSEADHIESKVFEKIISKELQLQPQVLVSESEPKMLLRHFLKYNNEFSALKHKLPIGIHLLTLEQVNNNTMLIRLENFLEKTDLGVKKTRKVVLSNLFENLKILNVKETNLVGNIWKENVIPLQWETEKPFIKSFNEFYGNKGEEIEDEVNENPGDWKDGIRLAPMEIRTFLVDYQFII